MGTASLALAHVGRRRCYDDPVGVHPATQGYQVAATSYERSRPGYAPEAVAMLVEALRITPGTRVVDVGAGTGKLTRQLLGTGARIVTVEPVAAMREQFRAVLPDVDVLQGSAEALPLPDGSVDVAVAGQVSATIRFVGWGALPLSALAGGLLGERLGLLGAHTVGKCLSLTTCLWPLLVMPRAAAAVAAASEPRGH